MVYRERFDNNNNKTACKHEGISYWGLFEGPDKEHYWRGMTC